MSATGRVHLSLREAAAQTRFAFHCTLLTTDEENAEAREIAAELLAGLQFALIEAYAPDPVPPICSGCSPIAGFEPLADHWFDFVQRYYSEDTIRRRAATRRDRAWWG